MRLFVGVAVPAAVREQLATVTAPLAAELPQLRFTPPGGWHLTLAFLGEVAADRVGEVRALVAGLAAGQQPVPLTLGHAGRFGTRALWLGVDDRPPGTLAQLGERLQAGLAAAQLPVQLRPVVAHLRLARSGRGPVDAAAVTHLEQHATPVRGLAWTAGQLTVWRSHLGSGPPRYEVVAAPALGG